MEDRGRIAAARNQSGEIAIKDRSNAKPRAAKARLPSSSQGRAEADNLSCDYD
jgi:hypothetical protein